MNSGLAELPPISHWAPSLVVCVVLVAIAVLMLRSQQKSWARRQQDESLDPADLLHYGNQFRRRTQTSFLMGGIGLLILIGDVVTELLTTRKMGPLFMGLFWGGILLLVSYLIILALLDALATTSHTKAALARLRAQQRQLEREAAELRERPQIF